MCDLPLLHPVVLYARKIACGALPHPNGRDRLLQIFRSCQFVDLDADIRFFFVNKLKCNLKLLAIPQVFQ